jgi:nucleoid-associated protein YgaU
VKVTLGGIDLDVFEQPTSIPLGGKQMLVKRVFPGGNVSFQNLGPDYRPITWTGTFTGPDAYERMMKVGLMRTAGKPVPLVAGKLSIKVIIEEFLPDYRTDFRIPFSITMHRVVTEKKSTKAPDKVAAAASNTKAAQAATAKSQPASAGNKGKLGISYTIKPRDTLSKIAAVYYKDPNRWPEIYANNKSVLKNGPHNIQVGWVIKL